MAEEERKFEVGTQFAMPDLSDCQPAGGQVVVRDPVRLTATYYDTADLRLARAGASMRFRRSAAPAAPAAKPPGGGRTPGTWTVKFATGEAGIRHEIDRPGTADAIPTELVALVTAYTLGEPLAPSVTLRTDRTRVELRDRDQRLLAEVDDDRVAVLHGRSVAMRFREVEVERRGGGRELLDLIGERLTGAGAAGGSFVPKHVRALGEAVPPPMVAEPDAPVSPEARAGEVVTSALRRDIAALLHQDPLVRLGEPLPDGDTAVHQMRVGCRRLRTDLRTFRPLLTKAWAGELRAELTWLADALGAARDAEVMRARLRQTAESDPLSPVDDAALARIDAALKARQREALARLDEVMRSPRYHALLGRLVVASAKPRLGPRAEQPARTVLPRLVSTTYRRLAYGKDGMAGAGELDPLGEDRDWHLVRINAKRARYAAQAVAEALGSPAAALAGRLAKVQYLLGEHQDAAVAAQTWLAIAAAAPEDHLLAVTAGRLIERERAAIREARRRFPRAWRAASRPRLTRWLP